MGKYTAPEVTVRDVAAALPFVLQPLAMKVSLYPVPGNSTSLTAAVELVVNRKDGTVRVWRRWGATGTASGQRTLMPALLRAAQEAFWYVDSVDPDELRELACWECDTPIP